MIRIQALTIFVVLVFGSAPSVAESNPQTDNNSESVSEVKEVDEYTWDQFAPPRDDEFDWLQLESGEWLKGDIISLFDYTVRFDSDKLGLMDIDWSDIKQIRSAGAQSMLVEPKTRNEKPFVSWGKLHVKDDTAVIVDNDKVTAVDREQIVSIASGAENEADNWEWAINLGADVNKGNTDTLDANLAISIARYTAISRFIFEYRGNYGSVNDIETTNNHRAQNYYDLFLTTRFFWRMYSAEYYRDEFRNILNQYSVATLLGYQFVRSPETKWEVGGGPGYRYKQSVSVLDGQDREITSTFLQLGTRLDREVTSWLDYLLEFRMQFLDSDAGGYTHHFITSLSTDLIGDLDLDISFIWDRIEKPQVAEDGTIPEKDDYQTIISISYEF